MKPELRKVHFLFFKPGINIRIKLSVLLLLPENFLSSSRSFLVHLTSFLFLILFKGKTGVRHGDRVNETV